MKNLIKALLLTVIVFGSCQVMGQNKLLITEIQIKSETMNKFERFTDKEANVSSDLPVSIALFKDQDITYYACFVLKERGNKFRLVNQDFVMYEDDKEKGDRQVLKYKKTEGVRGRITGTSEQSITFDDDLGRTINMVYRFEIVLD